MKLLKTILFSFLFISYHGYSQAQKEMLVNGKPINTNHCADIKLVKLLPEISAGFICEVRDAQIIENCIELTVVYGGCNGNLELMTDNLITADSKFTVKAKWIEPSFCKALMLTKVTFDLKPYKELITEKKAMVNVAGTGFELYYNN
ncbi:MAG: hypothetical protein K0S53_1210 [Bacteroidetes bacterium]|jgi:hypothetical protein|nr:hypothetical protein [Bacteroidota bacterium]MDF2453040.1 hypothetical protein [Bacteroidota bacterium]